MTTPQLLLLSGIGPKKENPSLDIPLIKELPAVGADFSDHYSIPIMLEIPTKETLHFLESALWGLWYMLLWVFTGKGFMSLSSAPSAIFLHTDSIDQATMRVTNPHAQVASRQHLIPNIEIMIIPLNSLERAVPGRSLFSIYPTVLQPRAKGKVSTPLLTTSLTRNYLLLVTRSP
jgi:choline dehydrogenase-like flavoprotein